METDNIDNKEHFSSALKEKNFDLTETAYSRLIKFKESGRLSGLSTFTSRLLRPIWLYPVIVCKNLQAFSISGLAKNPEVVYSTKILQSILRPLKNVDEFLKKHKRIFYSVGAYNNYIDALKNRDFAKCHKIEVERVEGIHKIIVRTVEILTLFEHCSKSAISLQTIFGKIGKNQQQSLTQCSLAELVCTEKGETALRTLMIKMVEEKAAESEFFKDNCSSIFRIDDVLVCSAQNTLKKAANFYPNAALFEKELEKADKELIAAAEMTGREFPFDNVIAKMNEARNFPGIVKLCLRLAKIIKTNEKIQKVASDRLTESKCFEKALSAFDEAINLYKNENSLNSKNVHFSLFQRQLEFMRKEVVLDGNKTFLRKLFLMLIEKKNNLYLFRFRSDCEFLSEFLEEECSNNLEIANVALALYLENKQFFKAASLARYWSVMKEGVDFERRLELISKSQRYFLSIERPSQKEQSFNLASRQYQIRISLQKKLIEALYLSSESSERVAKQVLPIKQLYGEARSSKVYEICLELHRHNFLEDVGGRLLAKFWQFVVLSELQMALNSMDWKNSLRLSISPLIKLASKNCDPRFDALALCLEKANNEHSKTIGKWITDTFLQNGVEAPFLAKTYQKVVDIAINSGFAQNFKANCQITVSIASVIEAICRYSEKLDRNEKKNVLEIGSKLAEIWKGQRIKASNDLQMRARKHVNQSFFAACLKINQAVASSWNK
ncbi:hypothetical protein MHBO_000315 [Bonamia ostreae]|uniref:Uncharacterized protein n=1 Tax=Bonamia ostreae TaxID=126728 RepID=A0ABV2AF65_9EUKA